LRTTTAIAEFFCLAGISPLDLQRDAFYEMVLSMVIAGLYQVTHNGVPPIGACWDLLERRRETCRWK
jgi:hypothetical protein